MEGTQKGKIVSLPQSWKGERDCKIPASFSSFLIEPKQISLPSLSCRAHVPEKYCVGLGTFLFVFTHFRKVILFFKKKKIDALLFSPFLYLAAIWMWWLGHMDHKATPGRTWKLARVFDGSVELITWVLECLTLTFYRSKKWNFILSEITLKEGGCGEACFHFMQRNLVLTDRKFMLKQHGPIFLGACFAQCPGRDHGQRRRVVSGVTSFLHY